MTRFWSFYSAVVYLLLIIRCVHCVRPSRYDKIHRALISFEKVHGHLDVPYSFIVPSEKSDAWAEECHGLHLGAALSRIRRRGDFKEHHEQLSKLGLHLGSESKDRRSREFHIVVSALEEYRRREGNCQVPIHFVIPSHGPEAKGWPHATLGLKLGQRVSSIRNKKTYVSNQEYRARLLVRLFFCSLACHLRLIYPILTEIAITFLITLGSILVTGTWF